MAGITIVRVPIKGAMPAATAMRDGALTVITTKS